MGSKAILGRELGIEKKVEETTLILLAKVRDSKSFVKNCALVFKFRATRSAKRELPEGVDCALEANSACADQRCRCQRALRSAHLRFLYVAFAQQHPLPLSNGG
jgi:hypothetical protein